MTNKRFFRLYRNGNVREMDELQREKFADSPRRLPHAMSEGRDIHLFIGREYKGVWSLDALAELYLKVVEDDTP